MRVHSSLLLATHRGSAAGPPATEQKDPVPQAPASGPMLPLRPAQEVLEGDPFVGTVGALMSPWQQCRVHEGRVRLSRISTGPATSYHPPTSVTRHGCSGPSSTDRGAASRGGSAYPSHPWTPRPSPRPDRGVQSSAGSVLPHGAVPPATGDSLPQGAGAEASGRTARGESGTSNPAVSTPEA